MARPQTDEHATRACFLYFWSDRVYRSNREHRSPSVSFPFSRLEEWSSRLQPPERTAAQPRISHRRGDDSALLLALAVVPSVSRSINLNQGTRLKRSVPPAVVVGPRLSATAVCRLAISILERKSGFSSIPSPRWLSLPQTNMVPGNCVCWTSNTHGMLAIPETGSSVGKFSRR